MKKETRIIWLDVLKGLLILTVILGHAIQSIYLEKGQDFMSSYIWRLIYSFHMPAFMAVSGFLTFKANQPQNINTTQYAIKRFKQLIIPFLSWSIILFFVNQNVNSIIDYAIYPNKSFWFLWALFFISVIFNFTQKISTLINIKEDVAIIITTLLLFALQTLVSNPKIFGLEYICYYYLFYSLGFFLHKYKTAITTNKIILISLIFIWFILGSYWQSQGIPHIIPQQLHFIPKLNIIYRIITAVIFIYAIICISLKHNTHIIDNRYINILTLLGKNSLGIYTIHMVLRFQFVRGLIYLLPGLPDYIYILTTFIILTVTSIFLIVLISKWKFTAFWLLGKISK